MRATCACTSAVLIRARVLVCASCGAPIVGGTQKGVTYATTPGTWPPGSRNRRQARDRIRAVPGNERIGIGPATVWSVSADAYRAHHGRQVVPIVPAVVAATDQEIADEALSGMRATRRTA